jgi:hypothetical protein
LVEALSDRAEVKLYRMLSPLDPSTSCCAREAQVFGIPNVAAGPRRLDQADGSDSEKAKAVRSGHAVMVQLHQKVSLWPNAVHPLKVDR